MKVRNHTPGQIVRKLREADRMLGEGSTLVEVCKHLKVVEQTYYRWRNQCGGMKADDAKRLRELEKENARLKRIGVCQGFWTNSGLIFLGFRPPSGWPEILGVSHWV